MRIKINENCNSWLSQGGESINNQSDRNVLVCSCEIESPASRNEKARTCPCDNSEAASHTVVSRFNWRSCLPQGPKTLSQFVKVEGFDLQRMVLVTINQNSPRKNCQRGD